MRQQQGDIRQYGRTGEILTQPQRPGPGHQDAGPATVPGLPSFVAACFPRPRPCDHRSPDGRYVSPSSATCLQFRLTSSVSGLLRDSVDLRQARSRRLPCYPGVAVITPGRPPERARGGHDHGSGVRRPYLTNLCGLPALLSCCRRTLSGSFRIYSGSWTVGLADRLLFRPDISPVGADRTSVVRCCRSLLVAGGWCCQPLVLFPIPR
jgi:hypothetical protein